jgi:hypothetical protein
MFFFVFGISKQSVLNTPFLKAVRAKYFFSQGIPVRTEYSFSEGITAIA